jgi:hypothetical protein
VDQTAASRPFLEWSSDNAAFSINSLHAPYSDDEFGRRRCHSSMQPCSPYASWNCKKRTENTYPPSPIPILSTLDLLSAPLPSQPAPSRRIRPLEEEALRGCDWPSRESVRLSIRYTRLNLGVQWLCASEREASDQNLDW